jgi:type IV fimbrial biogenesis protein FimT
LSATIRNRGLTLIELIIAFTVLAILIAIGTPFLKNLSLKNQHNTAVNGFLSSFYLARSLAIRNEQHEIICPSKDGKSCVDESVWRHGLIGFEDRDKDGVQGPNDPVFSQYLLPEASQLEIFSSEYRKQVIYHGDGRPSGYNLTLTFCAPKESQIEPKALIVNNVGRVRISDQGPDGSALECGH